MKATTGTKDLDLLGDGTPSDAPRSTAPGTIAWPSSPYRFLKRRVGKNIVERAVSAGSFMNFGRAIGEAGLVGALTGNFVQILYWTED